MKNIIVVDAGKESGWNNPEPNSVYKMNGDKTCHTNYLVRPAWVKAMLKAYVKDLNSSQQGKTGEYGNLKDEGGYLKASTFLSLRKNHPLLTASNCHVEPDKPVIRLKTLHRWG